MTTEDLRSLAADVWGLRCDLHPLDATAIGVRRVADRMPDHSPAGSADAERRLAALDQRLAAIPEGELAGEDRLTHSVLRHALDEERTILAADAATYTVDIGRGPQAELLSVPSYQPLGGPEDGAAMVRRWRAMGPFLDEAVDALRRGLEAGRTPIVGSVDRVAEQLRDQLATPLEAWTLMAPLTADHAAWPDADWATFGTDLAATVRDAVQPALARYLRFLEEEARPVARDEAHAGIGNLPGGAEIYRRQAAAHTTTPRSPEEIHAVGLAEIERIDAEMTELGSRVLGTRRLAETQERLRRDPAMHFATSEEVEEVARQSLARAQAAVPAWFGRLPETSCEVVRMLPHEERYSTIAYYRQPAADGTRPGQYYINTSEPTTRPRYEAEALAFHEAVPGHHLQIAIGQELRGLPDLRRFGEVTAFVEGWGLYTERLSDEMGLYTADIDRIGMLSFDAWRACRLVVDTGMHALGWSRSRAIRFMTEHSALAENNIANEIDRYLGWPGQALAYKVGQLELLEIRADAAARLGSDFDVRRFHDAILTHGALPLTTLRESVDRDL